MMSGDRQALTFFTMTFGLIVAFGGFVALSLLFTRPSSGSAAGRAQTRLPANVGSLIQEPTAVGMQQLQIPCLHDGEVQTAVIKTTAKQASFAGRTCDSTPLRELSVVNSTNGYAATVFQTKTNLLTTDYVALESGENHVLISRLSADGSKRSFELVVIRNSVAEGKSQQ